MKRFQFILTAAVIAMSNVSVHADVTQIQVNVTGTVAGAGEVKITVKDDNENEIGCYSFTVDEADLDTTLTRKDVVTGLEESEDLSGVNFEDKVGKEKTDTDSGIVSSVFVIKIKREEFGAKFQICGLDEETLPGINFAAKHFNGNEQVSVLPSELDAGYVGTIDVIGKGTLWTQELITDIDFGSGIFTESFVVLSDGLIRASIVIDPSGPLGPENVWVIGDVVDSFDEWVPNAVISTSNQPLLVTMLVGDVNCDGEINLLDVDPFVDFISSGEYSPKADTNGDGLLNLLDVASFIALLSG